MTTRHVDLRLPTGWNQCTTGQLEMIAATILRRTLNQDRYHPFDWTQVKAELFFLLSGITVLGGSAAVEKGFPCRYKGATFIIEPWQVQSFIDQHLKWVDDPNAPMLLRFPYKDLLQGREWRIVRNRWNIPYPWPVRLTYGPPDGLLQNYTWQQYRLLQEYMELYVRQANRSGDSNPQLRTARDQFLVVLFHCEHRPRLVWRVTDVQWQVILFWWAGFMRYLQHEYPHCFKSAAPKRGNKPQNPLTFYTNVTVTMQKYLQQSEQVVNAQTFHLTLEALERMAKESEEMEKLGRKHKK